MDLERWVQECVDITMAVPVDQETQADLLYATSLFGCIVHNSELYERLIPEELMRESKFYQRQMERAARETTIENTLALLKRRFHTEEVTALTPALQNINDLERLQQLLVAVPEMPSLEAFAQMLHE